MIIQQKNTKLIYYLFIILVIFLVFIKITGYYNKQIKIIQADLMSLDLGISSINNAEKTISSIVDMLGHAFNSYFFSGNKQTLYIDIKFADLMLLNKQRKRAIDQGVLFHPTEVPIKITYQGKRMKAKARLKGDLTDHWDSSKRFSLKVDIKGDEYIEGFKSFAIQKPRSRQYPYDYIYQEFNKRLGNLGTNHLFRKVVFNGDDWGIMGIEESMAKEFVEKGRKKDSLIFKVGDDFQWKLAKIRNQDHPINFSYVGNEITNLHLYKSKKKLKEPLTRARYSYVYNNLIRGRSELIFDQYKLSLALTLSNVWNSPHALAASNSRFYFNPYTLKLEIITSDQAPFSPIGEVYSSDSIINTYNHFYNNIKLGYFKSHSLSNLDFIERHIPYLDDLAFEIGNEFVNDKYIDLSVINRNFDTYSENHNDYLPALPKSSGEHNSVNRTTPSKGYSINELEEVSNPLSVKHVTNGEVHIFNLMPVDIELLSIKREEQEIVIDNKIEPSDLNIMEPMVIKTPFLGKQDNKLIIKYRFKGGNDKIQNIPFSIVSEKDYINPFHQTNTFDLEYLTYSNRNHRWEFKPGNWLINTPLVLEGPVYIPNATSLLFSDKAYLLVKGAFIADGSQKSPIKMSSIGDTWKGLYVLNDGPDPAKSNVNHIEISNVSNLSDGLLNLTGAVTFYNSDVSINALKITNITAEDGINFVDSIADITNLEIDNTVSDALDSDFSIINIDNSNFHVIGGDALDFSGSNVTIDKVSVSRTRDKAFSFGEESIFLVNNSDVNNSGVAFASKDGSKGSVINSSAKNILFKTAMTYVKKPFYGFPSLSIDGSSISFDEVLSQKGTNLTIAGNRAKQQALDVDALYSDGVMKK